MRAHKWPTFPTYIYIVNTVFQDVKLPGCKQFVQREREGNNDKLHSLTSVVVVVRSTLVVLHGLVDRWRRRRGGGGGGNQIPVGSLSSIRRLLIGGIELARRWRWKWRREGGGEKEEERKWRKATFARSSVVRTVPLPDQYCRGIDEVAPRYLSAPSMVRENTEVGDQIRYTKLIIETTCNNFVSAIPRGTQRYH